MRPLRLDDVITEVRCASLDLCGHLALRRMQRIATELRYREDQPRAPRGNAEGGQWIRDTTHAPNARPHGEAVRPPRRFTGARCDGFSAGCQNGGSFGTSGMFNIWGKRLCWDCAIKWLGFEELSHEEQLERIKEIDHGVRD
jgi:hypothetical protein